MMEIYTLSVDDWSFQVDLAKQTVHNDHGHISTWDVSSITDMAWTISRQVVHLMMR